MKVIILWIILNLLDALATLVALGRGLGEGNPLINWTGGGAGLVIYKVVLTVLALLFLARIKKLHLLRWLNIGMALIVAWNVTAVLIWG